MKKDLFEKHYSDNNIQLECIGEVGGDSFSLNDFFKFSLNQLKDIYFNTIPALMAQKS